MWTIKGCPKCRGDTFIDEDIDSCYEKCLQCGYERELVRVSRSNDNRLLPKKCGSI
jgi:hypothetical protein